MTRALNLLAFCTMAAPLVLALQTAQAEHQSAHGDQTAHRKLEANEEEQEDDAEVGDEGDLPFAGHRQPGNCPGMFGQPAKAEGAERGADNVFEALRGEPGLSLIGRTISGRRNLSLRGMDGRHTLFLVDGMRIGGTDGVVGHSDFQYDWVPVQDIERIEVLRGPMSVLYGAEALGGVVNVVTRAPGERWAFGALAEGSWSDGGQGGGGQAALLQAVIGMLAGQGGALFSNVSAGADRRDSSKGTGARFAT